MHNPHGMEYEKYSITRCNKGGSCREMKPIISHCDVDGLNCIIGTHLTHRVLQILWSIQQFLLAEMTRHIIRRSRSVKPKLTVANLYNVTIDPNTGWSEGPKDE